MINISRLACLPMKRSLYLIEGSFLKERNLTFYRRTCTGYTCKYWIPSMHWFNRNSKLQLQWLHSYDAVVPTSACLNRRSCLSEVAVVTHQVVPPSLPSLSAKSTQNIRPLHHLTSTPPPIANEVTLPCQPWTSWAVWPPWLAPQALHRSAVKCDDKVCRHGYKYYGTLSHYKSSALLTTPTTCLELSLLLRFLDLLKGSPAVFADKLFLLLGSGHLWFAQLFKSLFFPPFVLIRYRVGVDAVVKSRGVHSFQFWHLWQMDQSKPMRQGYQVHLLVCVCVTWDGVTGGMAQSSF